MLRYNCCWIIKNDDDDGDDDDDDIRNMSMSALQFIFNKICESILHKR